MNEKSKKRIDEILHSISDALGVTIFYNPIEEDQGKVVPSYDVNGILSKFIALMIFNGLQVPSNFAPAYNRVHADVEWWKQEIARIEMEPEIAPTQDPPAQ